MLGTVQFQLPEQLGIFLPELAFNVDSVMVVAQPLFIHMH